MAMDANLVAAYRDAKLAGVPQEDHVGNAIAKLNGIIYQMSETVKVRKAEEAKIKAEEERLAAEKELQYKTLAQEKEIQQQQLEINKETNRINREANALEIDRRNTNLKMHKVPYTPPGQGWYATLEQACNATSGAT